MTAALPNASENRILLSTIRFPIRWGDMDALQHVNNTLYLRYFEESRIVWSEQIGMPLVSQGEGMILASAAVTFKRPVSYPATVTVELLAGPVGKRSFTLINSLTVDGADAPAATAEFVIVWYDYTRAASAELPARLRRILETGAA